MQVGSSSQQALNKIDANKDGGSVQEPKTLDKDGNNTLSQDKAQQAGIAAEDTGKVNQALSRSAGHAPTEIAFVTTGEAGRNKKPSFSDVWRNDRDAGNTKPGTQNTQQLRNTLGIGDDWGGSPRLKSLVQLLENQGLATPENLSYLAEIGRRHGKGTLEAICNNLVNYHTNGAAAAGVSKNAILHDALHDIACPSDIDQSNRGTCGAAAIQMKLALERPMQYVETLTTLAQGRNQRTPGGDTIRPNNTWRGDAGDNRSISCKIMQNALMNFAGEGTFSDNTYNSSNDAAEDGMYTGEARDAMESLFGGDYDDDSGSGASLLQYVEDDIARGRPAVVYFKGHYTLAVGIDKSQTPPRVIMNTWGGQVSMTFDEFRRHVRHVQTRDDSGSDNRATAAGSRVVLGDR